MSHPDILHTLDGVRAGDPTAPLLVLGPSLGTTAELWAGPADLLAATHRVLRYDLPGHGVSPNARESFCISDLADAVIAAIDSVGGGPFHYAGVSLGGAVGLQLALRHPDRLRSVSIFCSGARVGTPEAWRARAAQVRASGTGTLVDGSAERWFAPGFLARDVAGSTALAALRDVDDESYALACEALAEFDVTDALGTLSTPTLCVSGEYDRVTPSAQLAELSDRIPEARWATIAGAAHLPPLERPREVTELLLSNTRRPIKPNKDEFHG
ncbi:alpha/beta fold hydrolase [Cryobacterium sp. Hz9]|uniref:alpha/beta fold hydrolase n=1 Tax=Cryobacterium sp. Hz9 TaxID=1259167 RepID=UPI0010691855|nr:alpha/beta fold hydrolase [Cryobacterium sp. Hz9]TFB67956.1 alpha/beta fold hydrolase [Cryobacterium sp. Hz9]